MVAVANMRITPVRANKPNPPQFQRNAARMNWYGSRQSYILQNKKTAGLAGFAMFCLGLINKKIIIGGAMFFEMIGLGKQVAKLAKLDPTARKNVPKGLLAARIAGWSTLSATFGLAVWAVTSTALPAWTVFTFLGGSFVGLTTLGVEKIVRGFRRRSNLKQTVNQVQTPEQARALAETIRKENVPVREQVRLGREALSSANETVAETLINELDPNAIQKLASAAERAGIKLDNPRD